MTKSEPKIKLQFVKDVQPSKKQKFTGKFRQTNSPRGRLTPEAKEFIKSLASQFDTVIAIQEHLKENYQEKVSLPTLKRCLL
jgi:hypothetical protein